MKSIFDTPFHSVDWSLPPQQSSNVLPFPSQSDVVVDIAARSPQQILGEVKTNASHWWRSNWALPTLASAGFGWLALAGLASEDARVKYGVSVAGVPLHGLDYTDTRQRCYQIASDRAVQPLVLAANGRTLHVTPQDLVLKDRSLSAELRAIRPFLPEVAAARAYLKGKETHPLQRLQSRFQRRVAIILPAKINAHCVERLVKSLDGLGENARAVWQDGAVHIVADRPGTTCDVNKSVVAIQNALSSNRSFVELPLRSRPAAITAAMLAPVTQRRVRVVVRVTSSHPNALHNVRLAVRSVQSITLLPGQTFSTNHVLGERTPARGFLSAPIFVEGQVKNEIAGGICVISSALFQAAARSGLSIVERHPHSHRVRYAAPGLDSTLYWRSKDLKFRNDTKTPVVLTVTLQGRRVVVDALGVPQPALFTLAVESQRIGENLHTTTYLLSQGRKRVLCHSLYTPVRNPRG